MQTPPETRQGMQALTQAVGCLGETGHCLLPECLWVWLECGNGEVIPGKLIQMFACVPWHFLMKTVSVEEILLAARLWLRLGSWHDVPSAFQGEVGQLLARTSYQPLGPSLAPWVGHPQAPTVAWRHALKTMLTEDSGGGHWRLPVSSCQGWLLGHWGQCRSIIVWKSPADWGAAEGLNREVVVEGRWSLWHLSLAFGP